MTEMNGKSEDLVKDNVRELGKIFPEALCDGKVDFGKLRALLGDAVESENDRYDFTWHGKTEALRLSQTPSLGTLRPCKEESKDWDTTQNLYIEGDNLEVLKLLQKSYHGKVKMIYIDPPYNTGNDFVYRDDFIDSLENYKRITGQTDSEGKTFSTNSESNGRYHTDWLNMIYPRLRLARNLLRNDGVIFISIDDHEQGNLKKVCDEIFGDEYFIATFPWRKRTAKSDVPFGVSQDYEWILAYAKSQAFCAAVKGKERKYYTTPDFPDRPWRVHDMTKQTSAAERQNSFFTIVNPQNGKEYPADQNRTWAITKDTFKGYYNANRIIFPGDYDFLNIQRPVLRYWKAEDMEKSGDRFGKIAVSTKLPDDAGMSQAGTKEITKLFDKKIFSFPKPVNLVKFFVQVVDDQQALVLDFFSGSATTAAAVMQQNAEDSGKRKFILVQLPENCPKDSEASLAGYDNLCQIGKERIRRAGEHYKDKGVDVGFRVFKLDTSNLRKWQPTGEKELEHTLLDSVDNIMPGRSDEDLLYEIILKMGFDLSSPVKCHDISGAKVFALGNGTLMICLSDHITTEVADGMAKLHKELAPQTWKTVFRDTGFENDAAKVNVREILKAAGLEEDAFVTV